MTEDGRRAPDADCGAVDRALDLKGVVVGVFSRGGGLQSRLLLNGAILGGDLDGDSAGLGSSMQRIIGDAKRLLHKGRIVYLDRE